MHKSHVNLLIKFACKVDISNLEVALFASASIDDMLLDGGVLAPIANVL